MRKRRGLQRVLLYCIKFPLCKTYRATGRMAILIMEAAGFHNNILQY